MAKLYLLWLNLKPRANTETVGVFASSFLCTKPAAVICLCNLKFRGGLRVFLSHMCLISDKIVTRFSSNMQFEKIKKAYVLSILRGKEAEIENKQDKADESTEQTAVWWY